MWRRRKGDEQRKNLINQFRFYIILNLIISTLFSCDGWSPLMVISWCNFSQCPKCFYCLSNVAICRMKIQRWHQGNDYANFKENIAHICFDICMTIIERWSVIAHHWTMPTIKISWTHSIRNRSVKINFVCITSSVIIMVHRKFLSNYLFDFQRNAL